MKRILYTLLNSPIGQLIISGDEATVSGIHICKQKHTPAIDRDWVKTDETFELAVRQLNEYFAGERTRFDFALHPVGTQFQLRVWQGLLDIPYGQTCSYGELAKRLGAPNASRAVGMANGRNPISIVVPCHRVIGANGTLTGYGGGLDAKKWLLDHESNHTLKS